VYMRVSFSRQRVWGREDRGENVTSQFEKKQEHPLVQEGQYCFNGEERRNNVCLPRRKKENQYCGRKKFA